MKPSELILALNAAMDANVVAFVQGPPGVGKSAIIQQIAAKRKMRYIDVRAVLLDPTDLRGLPYVKDGRTHWSTPIFLPSDNVPTMLHLDEINAAPHLVMAGMYQLLWDRQIGEYRLPEKVVMVASGNKDTDGAITTRLPTPLKSRFQHLTLDVHPDEWVSYALKESYDASVIGFIKWRPAILHQFDKAAQCFPCPRTWEFVSRLMKKGMPASVERDMLAGCVGEGAATEFSAFLRMYREIPDIDGIIEKPEKALVPREPSMQYAISAALSLKADKSNLGNIVKYMARVGVEYSVMAIRGAVQRDPTLLAHKDFGPWALQHQQLVIT